MENKKYDVVIVGGGLNGLMAAYVLTTFGVSCCLIEKNKNIGGGNISFMNDNGSIFDSGYHALDYMRSEITTKLFMKVLNNLFNKIKLNRGIYISGNLIEYNSPIEKWPKSISKLINLRSEGIITGEITEETISYLYGEKFKDLCVDDIFVSYPSEVRSLKEGGGELFKNIYPWFFPKLDVINNGASTEWGQYHNAMRSQDQYVLYPKSGGFFGFIKGIYDKIDKELCDVYLGCDDVVIDVDSNNICQSVSVNENKIKSDHYFWCAPFFGLSSILGLSLPTGVPQALVLGSFEIKGEFDQDFHEILVGDKNHKINRISFPGNLRGEKNNLLQVEFLFPMDEIDINRDEWFALWVSSLNKMGIMKGHEIKDFRFDFQRKGFIAKSSIEDIARQFEQELLKTNTNIFVPFVSVGPENINRLVPSVIQNTINYITVNGGFNGKSR